VLGTSLYAIHGRNQFAGEVVRLDSTRAVGERGDIRARLFKEIQLVSRGDEHPVGVKRVDKDVRQGLRHQKNLCISAPKRGQRSLYLKTTRKLGKHQARSAEAREQARMGEIIKLKSSG